MAVNKEDNFLFYVFKIYILDHWLILALLIILSFYCYRAWFNDFYISRKLGDIDAIRILLTGALIILLILNVIYFVNEWNSESKIHSYNLLFSS